VRLGRPRTGPPPIITPEARCFAGGRRRPNLFATARGEGITKLEVVFNLRSLSNSKILSPRSHIHAKIFIPFLHLSHVTALYHRSEIVSRSVGNRRAKGCLTGLFPHVCVLADSVYNYRNFNRREILAMEQPEAQIEERRPASPAQPTAESHPMQALLDESSGLKEIKRGDVLPAPSSDCATRSWWTLAPNRGHHLGPRGGACRVTPLPK
jgi:hypothetical protein